MMGIFNKTFSSQRPTVTNGPLGESRVFPEGFHLVDLPCALQQQGAKNLGSTADGVSSTVATHKLWFEIGTDLLGTDRVIVEGVTFEVVIIDPDVARRGSHGEAYLLEVSA